MKEIIDFLRSVPAFYVATCEDENHPRVRPFSLVMDWNGKLSFATHTEKPTYAQLTANPRIELCAYNPDKGEWMRISGIVEFTNDIELKKLVFETMPRLRDIYGSEQNPDLACFYITQGKADIYSFAATDWAPRTIQF